MSDLNKRPNLLKIDRFFIKIIYYLIIRPTILFYCHKRVQVVVGVNLQNKHLWTK